MPTFEIGLTSFAETPPDGRGGWAVGHGERLRQVIRLVNDLGVNLAGVEVILRLSNRVEELQTELARCRAELEQTRARLNQEVARSQSSNPDGRGASPGGGNAR